MRWWEKMSQGFLMVVSGPSGAGKGTVCKRLLENRHDIVYSVSVTTREKRPGEIDGVDYFFRTDREFQQMVAENAFLEHAHVHDHHYATPRAFVDAHVSAGEVVLLEIDVQGALQVKKNYGDAVFVFLLPPNMEELKRRIIGRHTETQASIDLRYANAFQELDFVTEYDYFVVNDAVEKAVEDIEAIVCAERHRVKRFEEIKEKVIGEEHV